MSREYSFCINPFLSRDGNYSNEIALGSKNKKHLRVRGSTQATILPIILTMAYGPWSVR